MNFEHFIISDGHYWSGQVCILEIDSPKLCKIKCGWVVGHWITDRKTSQNLIVIILGMEGKVLEIVNRQILADHDDIFFLENILHH